MDKLAGPALKIAFLYGEGVGRKRGQHSTSIFAMSFI